MRTKRQEMLAVIDYFAKTNGNAPIDMHEVAKYAVNKGWPLPQPESPFDRLAKQFSQAAREEIRYDKTTKKPYRAWHSITEKQGTLQLHLWVDIDTAPRQPMLKSLVTRREQMVADGLQLSFDADHWNSIHPEEEPIVVPMDLTLDIEWRKNSPDEDDQAA